MSPPARTADLTAQPRRRVLLLSMHEVVHEGRLVRAATALARVYDVEVIGWLRPERDTPALRQTVAALPFRVRYVTVRWASRLPKNLPGYGARFVEVFARLLAAGLRERPWAVYPHGLEPLGVAYLLALVRHCRLVWDAYELYPDQADFIVNHTRITHRLGICYQRFLMRRCDEIIACNRHRAEIMYGEYGAPFLPKVVRNLPPFKETSPGEARLLRFAQQQNARIRRVIVHTGGIIGRGEVIFPALAEVPDDVGLVLVGYPNCNRSARMDELLRTYGVGHRVFVHPVVPYAELQAHLSGADLGLVTYPNTCRNNYYCAPTKLHEYAMAGVPVVAVDFPPCREMLDQYEYGCCFEPDNSTDLAAKIRACLEQPARHARMVAEARRAGREVNWELEQRKLMEIFRTLEQRE